MGVCPRPHWGAYSAPRPSIISEFKGPTDKGREGRKDGREKRRG